MGRYITAGVFVAYGVMTLAGVVLWRSDHVRSALIGPMLSTATAFATITCLMAWRRLPGTAGRVWLLFSLAAFLATLSSLGTLFPLQPRLQVIQYLWLAVYGLILTAVVVALHLRENGRPEELIIDVALILTAATLVLVRWAPGPHSAEFSGLSQSTLTLVIFEPTLALSAAFLAGVLATGSRSEAAPGAVVGMVGATACLAISSIPQIVAGSVCCYSDAWAIFPSIGVWAFLAVGSVSAWAAGELSVPPPTRERLRQFVPPVVAIVLGAVSVHAALNPPLRPKTTLALGLLGALIALRLADLIHATRLQVSERRELAQTRALVEVSRALAGKNELNDALRVVARWVARVLDARAAAVELLSSDGTTLELRAAYGLPEHAVGMTFPLESSFTGWVILNNKARVTSRSNEDPFISPDSAPFLGGSPVAAVPLRYRERLLGVLSCVGNRPFNAADLELLRAFANQTALAIEDVRLFEQVRSLSITDPLTGLANRRQLDRDLAREFSAARRGRRLIAVMFDMDDFKQHNDQHGHLAGDEALRLFGQALRSVTRAMNLAARYGGDEFAVLLTDTDRAGAEVFVARVLELFHQAMSQSPYPVICASAGIAEFVPEMASPDDLIKAADRALYVAKRAADVSS